LERLLKIILCAIHDYPSRWPPIKKESYSILKVTKAYIEACKSRRICVNDCKTEENHAWHGPKMDTPSKDR
jgi:hypothetical protein